MRQGIIEGDQVGVASPVTCAEGAVADALISPGAVFTGAPAAGMVALA